MNPGVLRWRIRLQHGHDGPAQSALLRLLTVDASFKHPQHDVELLRLEALGFRLLVGGEGRVRCRFDLLPRKRLKGRQQRVTELLVHLQYQVREARQEGRRGLRDASPGQEENFALRMGEQ